MNFAKFLRTPFLQNTSERLLLDELLCREILLFEQYKFKARTREKGNSWKAIANNLNSLDEFKVDARVVRERYSVIKKKKTPLDTALEELVERERVC